MRYRSLVMLVLIGIYSQSALGQQPNQGTLVPTATTHNASGTLVDPASGYARYSSTYGILSKDGPRAAAVQFFNFNQVDASRKQSIREDAAIINHMIAKVLPLKNTQMALGVSYAQSFGSNQITYNDQGLTFVYHVPLMLMPREKKTAVESEKKTMTAWEKAKAELNQPERTSARSRSEVLYLANTQRRFDQNYVDRISAQVRTALNSAGNIRDLTENDMITVLVYGTADGQHSVKGWRVQWKKVKDGSSGLSAALEETSYVEKDHIAGEPNRTMEVNVN